MTLRDAAPTSRAMVVAVMVSMVAFLDCTVINLALPAIENDLGGGLALKQWIIDGYLLATVAAVLPGGSVSDLFGRVPVMRFGLLTFGTGAAFALGPLLGGLCVGFLGCGCDGCGAERAGLDGRRRGRRALGSGRRAVTGGPSNGGGIQLLLLQRRVGSQFATLRVSCGAPLTR